MAAGEAFTVDVQALNALGNPVPNDGNEQTPESITLAIDSLVFPSGGIVGTLTDPENFSKINTNTFRKSTISWNEVGTIRLTASVADTNYRDTGDIVGTASSPIGRFYPDRYFMSGELVGNSCSIFTYLSEPGLSVIYNLSAVDTDGNTVNNYDAGLGYPVAILNYHAEIDNNGIDMGSRLTVATTAWQAGEYSLSDDVSSLGG